MEILKYPLFEETAEGSTGTPAPQETTENKVNFQQTFTNVFGELPEEITPETLFDKVVNSEIGKAKLTAVQKTVIEQAQNEYFGMLKGRLGLQDDENIKDLDGLVSKYNSKLIESYSDDKKTLVSSRDKLAQEKAEFENKYKDLAQKLAEAESLKENAIRETENRVRQDMTIEYEIGITENVTDYAKNKPQSIRRDIQDEMTKKGLFVDGEMNLVHDGTKESKNVPLYDAKGSKVSLKQFIHNYMNENGLIQKQSVSGSGTLEKNPNEPQPKKYVLGAFASQAFN